MNAASSGVATAHEPGSAGPSPEWLPRGLLLVGIVCASATLWLFRDAFVDDAYISLRYADHLLRGDGLVFNPGERIEGFTNLGHVLAVAALGRMGLDLELAARLLGLLGLGIAVGLAPAAILPGPTHRLARAIARLLCLANFPFVYLSTTGMETGLYAGSIALAAWLFSRSAARVTIGVGAALIGVCLLRPDGVLVGLGLVGLAVAQGGGVAGLWRRCPGLWLWVAGLVALELWRWSYYGAWVPNTALVKGPAGTMDVSVPWYGLVGDDAVEFLAGTGGALGLLPVVYALFRHPERTGVSLAAVICCAVAAFELYAGGDWMVGYRFLLPLLPAYLTLVAAGLVLALRQAVPSPGRLAYPMLAAVLAVAAVASWAEGLAFRARSGEYPEYHMTSRPMAQAAHWLADAYPRGTSVYAAWIGALGYFTELVVIDAVGLTDATLARGPSPDERSAYLRDRSPDLILVAERPTVDFQSRREFWGRSYDFVRSFPMGVEAPWLLFERSGRRDRAGPE